MKHKHVGKKRTWLKVLVWITAIWAAILIVIQIVLSPAVLTSLANNFAEPECECKFRHGLCHISVGQVRVT